MEDYILEIKKLTKEFPGVTALDDVSLCIKRGEIHALCGENGAGKSTLIKILSGVYPAGSFSGEILLNGKRVAFGNARQALDAGIATIYQELELVRELSVTENIFLGHLRSKMGFVDWDALHFETSKLLNQLNLDISSFSIIKNLGIGQQQLVEIAKALNKNVDILILDEPTSALTETETGILIQTIFELKQKGVTCIYISHKLDEIFRVADTVTILRDGKSVGTFAKQEINKDRVISLMVGRELSNLFPPRHPDIGDVVFEAKDICVYDRTNERRRLVSNVSFQVHRGEILGISGLIGSGRTELVSSIFGGYEGKRTGSLMLNGKEISIKTPKESIDKGICLLTEDRKKYGLVAGHAVATNVTLSSLEKISTGQLGFIDSDKENKAVYGFVGDLGIKVPSIFAEVNKLSGGNQQKVVLAKCLMTEPAVLFLDEPTRGIDVLAKYEIFTIMNRLSSQGVAVVMVSSELPEIMGMSDRILVMCGGRVQAEFANSDDKERLQELIMQCAIPQDD